MYHGILWLGATLETTLHVDALHRNSPFQFDVLVVLEIKMRSLCSQMQLRDPSLNSGPPFKDDC